MTGAADIQSNAAASKTFPIRLFMENLISQDVH